MITRLAKRGMAVAAYAGHRAAGSAQLRQILFNAIRLNRIEIERLRQREEFRFLAYVFANRDKSRSQILQDLWVCYELGERRDGFFVEFGATNGVVNSNTWLLERKYGWTGVLAEPNPIWRPKLVISRNAAIDYRCVHADTGRRVGFVVTDSSDPELSCIAEFAGDDHSAHLRAKGTEIEVETVSLDDLLDQHHAPAEISYLSIDTEGSELAILSSFDFSRRVVDLISVEQNPTTEPQIEALLAGHGYLRVFPEFSQWDGWYVRADRRDARARLGSEVAAPLAAVLP